MILCILFLYVLSIDAAACTCDCPTTASININVRDCYTYTQCGTCNHKFGGSCECSNSCTWDGSCDGGYQRTSYSFNVVCVGVSCRRNECPSPITSDTFCCVRYFDPLAPCTNCRNDAMMYGPTCKLCPTATYDFPSNRALTQPCNGNGACSGGIIGDGTCSCYQNNAGIFCQFTPANRCNGLGIPRADGTCQCNTGYVNSPGQTSGCNSCDSANKYYGVPPSCTFCDPATTCNGRGTCSTTDGRCICNTAFTGARCDQCNTAAGYYAPSCTYCDRSQCSNSGNCASPYLTCVCDNAQTYGQRCSLCVANYATNFCTPCDGLVRWGTPCRGAGTCNQGYTGTGLCTCALGYRGKDCSAPSILNIVPSTGPAAGVTVTITGNFLGNIVYLSGLSLPPITLSATRITVLFSGVGNQSVTIVDSFRDGDGDLAVSNVVYFRFDPPRITSISPSEFPTAGGCSVSPIMTGLNFGKTEQDSVISYRSSTGNVTFLTRTCGGSWLDSRITGITVPPGTGEGNITITTGGQVSNVFSVRYGAPSITNVTTAGARTTFGGYNITVTGVNFGASPRLTFNGVVQTTLVATHTLIIFVAPAGGGANLSVQVTQPAPGSLSVSSSFSYDAPVVTNVTGCLAESAQGTLFCNVAGGARVNVTGANFGLNPSVTVNGFPCTFVQIINPDTRISCLLPRTSGYFVPVIVTAGNQPSAPAGLVSYRGPLILPQSVRACSLATAQACSALAAAGCGCVNNMNVAGGTKIYFEGMFWATSWTGFTVTVGVLGGGARVNCTLSGASDFYMYPVDGEGNTKLGVSCTVGAGVGKDLKIIVQSIEYGFPSDPSSDSVSFTAPVLTSGSLRLLRGANLNPSTAVTGTTTRGELVRFGGNNFGATADNRLNNLTVFLGTDVDPRLYPCTVQQANSSNTDLLCRNAPNGQGPNNFMVCAGNGIYAQCSRGTDVYTYPDRPIVTRVSGCTDAGNATIDCPTSGRLSNGSQVVLLITGSALPTENISITISGVACTPVNIINPTVSLSCNLPIGTGILKNIIVASSEGDSASKQLVSYAGPAITILEGCSSAGSELVNCPREGGVTVTVSGINFGQSNAKVYVGGSNCDNVTHDSSNPHGKVTCVLPAGTEIQQSLVIRQNQGQMSVDALFVSYYQCQPGTYALSENITCSPCEPGYYAAVQSQDRCLPCEGGKFSRSGAAVCTDCAPGTASKETAASFCPECLAGYYADGEKFLQCKPCGKGTFSDHTGARNCTKCPIATYQNDLHSTDCLPCQPGYFMALEGAGQCTACPAGKISSILFTSCDECPVGTIGVNGASPASVYCVNCSVGFYSAIVGSDECLACPPGEYIDIERASACLKCPAGNYSGAGGSDRCLPCPAGKISLAEGSSDCEACDAGTYSLEGQSQCTVCQERTYQKSFGESGCLDCPVGNACPTFRMKRPDPCRRGTYNNDTAQKECTPCPIGRFASGEESLECKDCAPGFIAPDEGRFECRACPGGYASLDTTICYPCPIGRISSAEEGSDSCIDCPDGSAPNLFQTQCLQCSRGKYSTNETEGCQDCDIGRFASDLGLTECSFCQVGRYQPDIGKDICIECPTGRFANETGLIKCPACQSGFYAINTESTACEPCPPGRSNPKEGEPNCFQCQIGRYAPDFGSLTCFACNQGYYQDQESSTECMICPRGRSQQNTGESACDLCDAGSATNQTGSASCTPCLPGFYTDGPGKFLCVSCPIGKAQKAAAEKLCDPCPAGTYGNATGLSSCYPCAQGEFSSTISSESCTSCSAGQYQDSSGQQRCIDCAAGKFSNTSASTVCITCPPGSDSTASSSFCDVCPRGKSSLGGLPCTECPQGKYANITGMSRCIDCPVGKYQDQTGSTECILTAKGYINPDPGASKMRPCVGSFVAPWMGMSVCIQCFSKDSAVNKDNTMCLCPAGTYSERLEKVYVPEVFNATKASLGLNCLPCPLGTRCDSTGVTFENLETSTGWWRADPESLVFYRCLLPLHCRGGHNSTCGSNREGPLCALCQPGYTSNTGTSICDKCPEKGQSFGVTVVILLAICVFMIVLYYIVLRNDRDLLRDTARWDMLAAEQQINENDDNQMKVKEAVVTKEKRVKVNYTDKLKILLGFAQIIANITFISEVPWPTAYTNFVRTFKIINLDFVPWQSVGCVAVFDYYTKFYVMTATPLVVLFILTVVILVRGYIVEMRDFTDAQTQRRALKNVRRKFWKCVIFTLFLMYPGVSNTVASFFICKSIQGQVFLLQDFSVKCYDRRWTSHVAYALFTIVIYPVGIPAILFKIMWNYKKDERLQEPGVRLQIGFLYEAFYDDCWWFEMADMAHKLILSTILAFFPSDAQMPFALVVVMLYTIAILYFKPYIRKGDDSLHLVAQTELFHIILIGYILYSLNTNVLDSQTDLVLSIFMIGATISLVILAVYMVALGVKKAVRNYQLKQAIEQESTGDGMETDGSPTDQKAGASSAALIDELPNQKLGLGRNSSGAVHNQDVESTDM